MSVSAVSLNVAAIAAPQTKAPVVRAADGDYKVPTAASSKVKDSDGDYKPLAASASAAKHSTAAVQAKLSALKIGG